MSKFEAILPLTSVQEALRLHHIFSQKDKGVLYVRCTWKGPLNTSRMQKAWDALVKAHPVLRTTIHWEKIKQPVQIIHHFKAQPLEFKPFGSKEDIAEHIREGAASGMDLTKLPNHKITFYSDGDQHFMVWQCHHIHLDGWSTVQLLREWLLAYEGHELQVGQGMKTFLQWQKAEKAKHEDQGKDIFRTTAASFPRTGPDGIQKHISLDLDQASFAQLDAFAKGNGLTLNTLCQAAWALCLHRISGQGNVAFGMTTSGRSGGHPLVQNIAGLLANVVPIFSTIDPENSIKNWLSNFQKEAVQSMGLDLWSINELQDQAREKGSDFVVDSLFTFENFPWEDVVGEEMTITGFSSGITSNYPVTMIAVPSDGLSFHLHFDNDVLTSTMAEEVLALYQTLLTAIPTTTLIHDLPQRSLEITTHQPEENRSREIQLPKNSMEVTLLKIWQRVLGMNDISVTDNYFALGGKSIQALQVFSMLQAETGKNVAPAALLQYPTIRSLAEHVSEGSEANWSSLVPLQVTGKGGPLFTIHAGGAHVFVYRALAEALKDKRPVYAIQPYGLDGSGQHNQTIEDMTRAYLEEIKKVQPEGPIHILGYCFSAAIAAEMAFHLKKAGRTFSILIVDSAPGLTYGRPKLPLGGRIKKLFGMFTSGQWARVREVVEGKWDNFKAKYLRRYEGEQMRTFRKVEAMLGKVYTAYTWKAYDGPIHLVRSSEFIGRSDKDIHVEEWDRLVGKDLHIHPVEGQHKTLFDPPHVTHLAKVLEDIMSSKEDGKTV